MVGNGSSYIGIVYDTRIQNDGGCELTLGAMIGLEDSIERAMVVL